MKFSFIKCNARNKENETRNEKYCKLEYIYI